MGLEISGDTQRLPVKRSHRDHRIYGEKGCMHDIAFVRRSKISYVITCPVTNAKVFGHNGLSIRTWWPLRVAARCDGAHGPLVGGISGNGSKGAYSIVVSSKYSDLDADYGNILYYSGSGSHDNRMDVPTETTGVKALERSLVVRKPIRVLRTSGSQWAGSPKAGIRYDGLYNIHSREILSNQKGGKYCCYKFVRCKGQPEIDTCRPTPKQIEDSSLVRQGY